MTNDDKQLIKDIAVICGYKDVHESKCGNFILVKDESTPALRWIRHVEFNPLAETIEAKAFCWDLIDKHNMNVYTTDVADLKVYSVGTLTEDVLIKSAYSLQRAVLLAVRELNKDNHG